MQQNRIRRRKFSTGAESQKRFLSIVFVFFSVTFLYFCYKHFTSRNYSTSLKLLPNTVQNVAINKRKITSTEHNLKPLPFASVDATDLLLYFPAHLSEVKGIGFHESEKKEALTLRPVGGCFTGESTQTVSRSISFSRFPILFVMYSRGKRQTPTSAVDVGVKPGTTIRSPVDGVVSKIQTYYLYGRYVDFRIEIQPKNHPELRVAVIHLDNIGVKVGDKVYSGKTELGKVRELSDSFDSQINEYIPEDCNHIHIQVNKYVPEAETKN